MRENCQYTRLCDAVGGEGNRLTAVQYLCFREIAKAISDLLRFSIKLQSTHEAEANRRHFFSELRLRSWSFHSLFL